MPSSRETIDALVARPQEALPVELKGWIDPATPEGVAKIAKTCMAMRNRNGGFLLIGFSDVAGEPDPAGAVAGVRESFHPDEVQSIVSSYASEPFEVHVHFVDRGGKTFPVLEVEPGVKTPVAAKRRLEDSEGARPDPEEPRLHPVSSRERQGQHHGRDLEGRAGDHGSVPRQSRGGHRAIRATAPVRRSA